MTQVSMLTAADYADALMVARRAKFGIFIVLLLVLLGQLALFFTARYTTVLPMSGLPHKAPGSELVQLPLPATLPMSSDMRSDLLHYLTGLTLFLGIALPIVLSLVLLLLVTIMLVGRLIGVARVTSAFVWCLFLIVLLFPWQAFLNSEGLTTDRVEFKVPGALYNWSELSEPMAGARFENEPMQQAALKWSRFVVFPLVTLIILMVVQVKSSAGLKQALGEAIMDEPSAEV